MDERCFRHGGAQSRSAGGRSRIRRLRYPEVAKQISKPDKTSMVIDRAKAEKVRKALGTDTLAATVDAAFDEVLRLEAHRRLMDRIRRDGGIGPSPDELGRLRRRPTPPVSR
jgi:Arc/MetJ family transcription regulator